MFSSLFTIITQDPFVSKLFAGALAAEISLLLTLIYYITYIWDYQTTFSYVFVLFTLYKIVLYFLPSSQKRRYCDQVLQNVPGRYVQLLFRELAMEYVQSPSIVAVFEETHTISPQPLMASQINWIIRRLRVIVEKNPFLAGRLRTDPSTGSASIWIPSSKDYIDKTCNNLLINQFSLDKDESLSFKSLSGSKYAREILVPTPGEILDEEDIPLARFAIFTEKKWNTENFSSKDEKLPNARFAITFSICHAIADAHSLYKIYEMLDPVLYPNDEDVKTLKVDRDLRFDLRFHHLQHEGKQHFKKFLVFARDYTVNRLGADLFAFLRLNRYNDVLIRRAKRSDKWFKLRKDWIENEKKKYPQTQISTNDILVKHIHENFYQHLNCGLFACPIELRSRFFITKPSFTLLSNSITSSTPTPLDTDLLGNYYDLLFFTRDEVSDPVEIRRIVKSKGRTSEENETEYDKKNVIPEGNSKYSRYIPVVTNWVSFYKNVNLSGFRVSLHAPIQGFIQPTSIVFVCNGDGDLAVMNTCDVQPENDKEGLLDGELEF